MAETPPRHHWIDGIVFWLLGGALVFSIGVLPSLLLALFYGPVIVHIVVVTACLLIVLLLWVALALRTPQRSPSSPRSA